MSEQRPTPPVQRSGYVIVTTVQDGPTHVYGPATGGTYETRQRALTDVRKMRAADRRNYPNDTRVVAITVHKVLGEGLSI